MFKSNAKKNELFKEQLAAENMEKQGRPTLPSLSLQAASSLLLPCSVLHHISYLKIMMMITDYDCDDKKKHVCCTTSRIRSRQFVHQMLQMKQVPGD